MAIGSSEVVQGLRGHKWVVATSGRLESLLEGNFRSQVVALGFGYEADVVLDFCGLKVVAQVGVEGAGMEEVCFGPFGVVLLQGGGAETVLCGGFRPHIAEFQG